MKTAFQILGLLMLVSCHTAVFFDQPQPKNGIVLHEVPIELRGEWTCETETITISEKCFEYDYTSTDNLGNQVDSDPDLYCLSESINIQQAGDYFVVNIFMPDEDQGWQVLIIDRQKNGDIIWYYPITPPFFGKGHGLKVERVEKKYNTKIINDSTYKEVRPLFKKSLKPSDKVEEFTAVYYSGQFRIKDIKRILIPENIDFIFRKNGTYEMPNDLGLK